MPCVAPPLLNTALLGGDGIFKGRQQLLPRAAVHLVVRKGTVYWVTQDRDHLDVGDDLANILRGIRAINIGRRRLTPNRSSVRSFEQPLVVVEACDWLKRSVEPTVLLGG